MDSGREAATKPATKLGGGGQVLHGPGIIPTNPVHSCDVEEGQKVPCGYASISANECDAIGCCYSTHGHGHRCYYGKAGECLEFCLDFIYSHV